jgi:hypothetical protein
MSKFVVCNAEQAVLLGLITAEHDAGIFHASYVAGNIYRYGVRIYRPSFTVIFDASLCVFGRPAPGLVAIAF